MIYYIPIQKKHFTCDYFQNTIFNNSDLIPNKSFVSQCNEINKNNVIELLKEYPYLSYCYSYLRKIL